MFLERVLIFLHMAIFEPLLQKITFLSIDEPELPFSASHDPYRKVFYFFLPETIQ